MGTFFSDAFGVDPDKLDAYGAFDVSVINDLPLFIDPFLLFHSEKPEYQDLHTKIIDYLVFLRDRSTEGPVSDGLLQSWYCFPEVRQNWLGFSLVGNGGSGLGMDFARTFHSNLSILFADVGSERITESSHLEKVCLLKDGVGKDNISDFVTNLILDHLCTYTQTFALENLSEGQRKEVVIDRASFDFNTQSWKRKKYVLPWINGDFILLTPKDMLTREETWINRKDMISGFDRIPAAIPDRALRDTVSNYFHLALTRRPKPKKPATAHDRAVAASETIREFPQLLDYYIRMKEQTGDQAADLSADLVLRTELFFSEALREVLQPQLREAGFYEIAGGTYAEAHTRLAYLKHAIEDQGCWRIFYDKDQKAVEREKDVQVLFRLVWFGTFSDISAEANDGRGPVDFKVSKGRHKTLVEMKLAKNTKLEDNLAKQVEIYQRAADAERGIKAIAFFSYEQHQRVLRILAKLGLDESPDIVLLDARSDNKPSASKA